MKTNKWTFLFVLAGVLASVSASALAQRHRGGEPVMGQPTGGGVAADYNFQGEWAEMVAVVKFDAVQKESLHKLLDTHDAALKACDKAQDEAAKAQVSAKTDADRQAAQAKLDQIPTLRQNVERNTLQKAFDIMRDDQKKVWTGYSLNKFFTNELSSLSPALADDQVAKVKAICGQAGARSPAADPSTNKDLLGGVRKDIVEKVLTGDQKNNMPTAPAADPPK